MFWRLRNTLAAFMRGRYGTDALNNGLMVTYLVLWVVSLFLRYLPTPLPGTVLWILCMVVLVTVFYRMCSRNIARRRAENAWFLRQRDRVRDIRRWRYRRCPYCKAHLRLPIRRGRRTVTCSRCHAPFKAFFL